MQCKFPPQNHAGSLVDKNNREREREIKKYLVLPSGVRVLQEESQTGAEREVRTTHQYYTCIVTMHASHDGKPWLSH